MNRRDFYSEMEGGKARVSVCMLLLACTNQAISKEQRIFVTTFTQNFHQYRKNMYLYISSSRTLPVNVDVIVPFLDDEAPFATLTLTPGQRGRITLPTDVQLPYGTVTSNKIVRVVADDDVTVMALNSEASNVDMYQVREVAQLGKEYIVATPQTVTSTSASTIGIVSPYRDTEVKVTLPNSFTTIPATIDDVPQTLSREFSLMLKENQTFQIQSKDDLSGTYILSDKPVAVLTGVNRTATVNGLCLDGQVAQLLSLDKLGTQYIAFGLPLSNIQDHIHVVSTQPNTSVTFDGTTTIIEQAREITRFLIDRNQFKLVETSSPSVVSVSLASGKGSKRQGDPAMYSLLPLPLRGLQYTITIPDNAAFGSPILYLVLMVETDGVDDILLDDVAITGVTWQSVQGTNISACYYSVTDNSATRVLRHRNRKPFAVYLQGFRYCQAYAMAFEPYETDIVYHSCHKDEVKRRGGNKHEGRRMTSQRMKFLTVEFLSACFSHCLRYTECVGVNFSTEVTPGDTNCQLLFTQTDGQVDTADWTYYQLITN